MNRVWKRFFSKLWKSFLENVCPEIVWFIKFLTFGVLPFYGVVLFYTWTGLGMPLNILVAMLTYVGAALIYSISSVIYKKVTKIYNEAKLEVTRENKELMSMIDE